MATYTTNYNLKKPALADKIRIADFNGNSDTIDGAMHDNAVLGAQLKSDIGIVENTNTATHNISAGQYVIWKGDLYTASDAISSGATLSNANLTAVSGGGLNALNDNIPKYSIVSTTTSTLSGNTDNTITIDSPGTYTEILAIIPFGYTPSSSWNTRLQFTSVTNLVNRKIGARTIGTDSQTYSVRCVVIYR